MKLVIELKQLQDESQRNSKNNFISFETCHFNFVIKKIGIIKA